MGRDYIKHAFIAAHEADPDLELYYNDYGIEFVPWKMNNAIELLQWLRSEGVTVHGIGLQWHISVSTTIEPNDVHYQLAQQVVDNGFKFIVTEIDVSIGMNGSHAQDEGDYEKQADLYRALVRYCLHFAPHCRALLTWGFTDAYSWIPWFSNHTRGNALPLDSNYQPKPAYWQMQEELARVLPDGLYRILAESSMDWCLEAQEHSGNDSIQINTVENGYPNQEWYLTWLGDGTYSLSSVGALMPDRNSTNSTEEANNDFGFGAGIVENHGGWVIAPVSSGAFRMAPRDIWWQSLTAQEDIFIGLNDYIESTQQHWIFREL